MLNSKENQKRIVVIGGGASGLMASYFSAINGNKVILLEKNEKLGKKIYITGKGRCNLTNYVDCEEFLSNVVRNGKFLFSSVNSFSPYDTYSFFEDMGLKLKVERGNRVFPESDKASDVTKTLERALENLKVDIKLNCEVKDIVIKENKVESVILSSGEKIACDSCIVCTGGISYPLTGSTGDGYAFAKRLGHTVSALRPALVGIELEGNDFTDMQGLTLKNVRLYVFMDGKELYSNFGEMLFTHFGISGPIVLSCSSNINRLNGKLSVKIDLKPALDTNTLDARLVREFNDNSSKEISNVMRSLVPQSLVKIILRRSMVAHDKRCSEITKEERARISYNLKNLEFKVKKLRPIEEAVVTSGGVEVKEINPKTMESKIISGLFFAGEVLDVDAYTGGFNLQIAFSTGITAGKNA